MLRAKIDDLLKELGDGGEWYCYQVPEEYHVWTLKYTWRSMEKYGVLPVRIKVHGVVENSEKDIISYTKKSPKILNNGLPVKGKCTASQNQTVNYEFRPDTTNEINESLTELANMENFNVPLFSITEIDVIHNKSGALLKCERYNPDGNGASLYIIGFHIDGEIKLFPHVPLGNMRIFIGDFKQNIAHCQNAQGLVHACLIKNKVKIRKQVKRRDSA